MQVSRKFRVFMLAASVLYFLAGMVLLAAATMDATMPLNLVAIVLLLAGFAINVAALRVRRER